jgi:hypothetical protein
MLAGRALWHDTITRKHSVRLTARYAAKEDIAPGDSVVRVCSGDRGSVRCLLI